MTASSYDLMMKNLLLILAFVAVPAQAETLIESVNPVQEYQRLQAEPKSTGCIGHRVQVDIDPAGLELMPSAVLYRMAANQVTEGWNWHPDSAREGDDYYHYKYLPLLSVDEDRGSYKGEDKIGVEQEFRVLWRYDYFFAFDNLYDFFARRNDADAGFRAVLSAAVPVEHLGMRAQAVLAEPCTTESTTFWKAIHARPVDFTLKKRYLLGKLDAVVFFDRRTGVALGRMNKSSARQQ
jgi:hypothetical protein